MSVIASTLALAAAPHRLLVAQELAGAPAGMAQAGQPGSDGSVRSLDLTVWMGGGHDTVINRAPVFDPALEPSNSSGQLGAGAAYGRIGKRLSLTAGIDSTFRLNSAGSRLWALDDHATFGLGFDLTSRTRVEVRQVAKYAAANPLIATPGTASEETSAI